jgi:hypothetical protein
MLHRHLPLVTSGPDQTSPIRRTNRGEALAPRGDRTDVGSDYPTSPIISLASSLVKHVLPNFLRPAKTIGTVESIISNLTTLIAKSRHYSFLQSDKENAPRFGGKRSMPH